MQVLNDVLFLIVTTLMFLPPLVFGAVGGVVSECAGVVNIGIEGMMTIGAFVGATVGYFSGNPWAGFICAGIAGGLFALLHAVASISCKADQTISGIALNLIGPGVALFFSRIFFEGSTSTKEVPNKLPKLFGTKIDSTVLIAVMFVILVWFVFYKTKWGLRIRAVGEYPAAADTLGINVSLIRYVCVFVSGALAGFGGASVTLAVVSSFFPTAICGQGFIALAAVIFGKWKPQGAFSACLLFAFARALTVSLGGGKFIPQPILEMFPYFLTLVVLILFVGKSVSPKANGKPYIKGER